MAQIHGPMRSGFLCLVTLLAGVTVAVAQTPNHVAPPDASCPGDKVVWVNTRSGIYHFRGERYFGSTKQGKFICEGDRPTQNGQ